MNKLRPAEPDATGRLDNALATLAADAIERGARTVTLMFETQHAGSGTYIAWTDDAPLSAPDAVAGPPRARLKRMAHGHPGAENVACATRWSSEEAPGTAPAPHNTGPKPARAQQSRAGVLAYAGLDECLSVAHLCAATWPLAVHTNPGGAVQDPHAADENEVMAHWGGVDIILWDHPPDNREADTCVGGTWWTSLGLPCLENTWTPIHLRALARCPRDHPVIGAHSRWSGTTHRRFAKGLRAATERAIMDELSDYAYGSLRAVSIPHPLRRRASAVGITVAEDSIHAHAWAPERTRRGPWPWPMREHPLRITRASAKSATIVSRDVERIWPPHHLAIAELALTTTLGRTLCQPYESSECDLLSRWGAATLTHLEVRLADAEDGTLTTLSDADERAGKAWEGRTQGTDPEVPEIVPCKAVVAEVVLEHHDGQITRHMIDSPLAIACAGNEGGMCSDDMQIYDPGEAGAQALTQRPGGALSAESEAKRDMIRRLLWSAMTPKPDESERTMRAKDHALECTQRATQLCAGPEAAALAVIAEACERHVAPHVAAFTVAEIRIAGLEKTVDVRVADAPL